MGTIAKYYKGTPSGDLYLDEKTFFERDKTKEVIQKLEESAIIKKIRRNLSATQK